MPMLTKSTKRHFQQLSTVINMKIFNSIHDWRATRQTIPAELSVGFAPTMGNLHLGHQSLYDASTRENDLTVASIFINPTQFNQSSDFTLYPRTLDNDLELLQKAGVDYCVLPNEAEIYADHYHYQVQENEYSLLMEGKHRPGHFTGVLTVVLKLLNLVKANRAYFGEKDYQQLQLIRQMVDAFFIDTDIKSSPTIRESSGLAFSSRNSRLTINQRELADQFARVFHQKNCSSQDITAQLHAIGVEVEYLEELEGRRFIAVKIGDIRLIDNYRR